jgi:hypothetical protein
LTREQALGKLKIEWSCDFDIARFARDDRWAHPAHREDAAGFVGEIASEGARALQSF